LNAKEKLEAKYQQLNPKRGRIDNQKQKFEEIIKLSFKSKDFSNFLKLKYRVRLI